MRRRTAKRASEDSLLAAPDENKADTRLIHAHNASGLLHALPVAVGPIERVHLDAPAQIRETRLGARAQVSSPSPSDWVVVAPLGSLASIRADPIRSDLCGLPLHCCEQLED